MDWFMSSADTTTDRLARQLVASKYHIVRVIGRGGMATVYEARHAEIGKRVAIKVLNAELAASTTVTERFIREARAAAAIESPYICAVHDVGRMEDGRPFLVLDLLQGESLFERLSSVRQLSMLEAVQIFSQVTRGLGKAHDANIIHRDLKPENIFLAKSDEGDETAKIVDFGLAKFYATEGDGAERRLTREGTLFGTPLYMSPEQVTQEGTVDHRVDLWALGCMVYEALTGQTVWNNDRGVAMVLAQIAADPIPVPSKIRPELPATFDAWFAKALQRNPDNRFQTAREFMQELVVALGFDASRAPFASVPLTLESFRDAAMLALPAVNGTAPNRETAPITPKGILEPEIRYTEAATREPRGSATEVATTSSIKRPAGGGRSQRTLLVAGGLVVVALVAAGVLARKNLFRADVVPASATVQTASPAVSVASGESASPSATAPILAAPTTLPAWAVVMQQAQETLARGDAAAAIKGFEQAAATTNCGPTRAMLEHVRIAAASKGACRLAGLGRPRSPEAASAARHLPLLVTPAGVLASWIDDHHAAGQPSLSSAWVDGALRSGGSIDMTPEGALVSDARLVWGEGSGALVYGDTAAPGLFARGIDKEGSSTGIPVRLSESKTSASRVSLVRSPAGELWAIWADDSEKVSTNLFARHLAKSLQPDKPAVQLTRYAGVYGPVGPRVVAPVALATQDQLLIAYLTERGRQHDILFHRIAWSDPQLGSGVGEWGKPPRDMLVGAIEPVGQVRLKVQPPAMACEAGRCLVAWKSEPQGSHVAVVDIATGKATGRLVASAGGKQIGVGLDGAGHGLAAWYEGSQLRVAPIQGTALGAPAAIGRVGGEQPDPSVVWANGAWLVAWTSFEGGHAEAYVARVLCE
jgi:eukaryotic-like serine/threonine-protein kinase